MVKTIQVSFDDNDHETLLKAKNGASWRDFILSHQKVKSTQESHKNANIEDMEQDYDLR